jgi:hypothetical protein
MVAMCTWTAVRVWERPAFEGNMDQEKPDRKIDIAHFMQIAAVLEAFKLPGLD